MRHIHDATDGFRTLHKEGSPSFLDAHRKLPPVYWGAPSGMRCMDTVVGQVIEKGWSHHITRLMVLSNLATLVWVLSTRADGLVLVRVCGCV